MEIRRILALVCAICPLCIARRRWPDSLYAKIVRIVEKPCPFCRAYNKIHPEKS